jgi:hypothetical protein
MVSKIDAIDRVGRDCLDGVLDYAEGALAHRVYKKLRWLDALYNVPKAPRRHQHALVASFVFPRLNISAYSGIVAQCGIVEIQEPTSSAHGSNAVVLRSIKNIVLDMPDSHQGMPQSLSRDLVSIRVGQHEESVVASGNAPPNDSKG